MTLDGGFNLGDAFGRVVIDTSGVDAAMGRAQQSFRNGLQAIGAGIDQLGSSMSRVGDSLTILTAPLTAFGVTGVRTAASFQEAMTQISARTGVVGDELQALSAFALQMGADTVFSGQQAADALLQLLTSGSSVTEAMAILPSVLNAAAASGGDLGRTADTLTDIMASFGLEADDAAGIVDSLARASGSSSATLDDLGQGFGNVGNVARNFGLSVDETAAILAIFSENGIKGSEAGTQLRSMLLNMSRPTEEVRGAWTRLGVSLYDADGNVRDLNTVIGELDAALDALPVDEQNEEMYRLAGSYGLMGLSALRSSMSIGEMQAMMGSAASATEVADAMMGTFNNTVGSLMGSVETLQIAVLTPFMENTLQPLAARLIEVVNAITAWVQANPELTDQIVRVLTVVVAIGPGLSIAGRAVSAFGGLFTGLGGVLSVVASGPFGLILGALAALGAAYATNFLGFRDAVTSVAGTLESALAPIGAALQRAGELVGGFFAQLGEGVPLLDALFAALLAAFGPETATTLDNLFRGIAGAVESVFGLVERFFGFLGSVWETVRPSLEAVARWFVETALPAIVDFVTNTVLPAITNFFTFIGRVWDAVSPALLAFFNWFVNDALPRVVEFIDTTVRPVVEAFFNFIGAIWSIVGPVLGALAEWFLTSALPAIVGFIGGTVSTVFNTFVDILRTIWNVVGPPLTALYNWFASAFRFIGENFVQPVIRFVERLIALVSDAIARVRELLGLNNQPFQAPVPTPRSTAAGVNYNPAGNINWATQDEGGFGRAGVPYLIGRGAQPELFVPQTDGTFYPNADRLPGGGDTFHVSIVMPERALESPAAARMTGEEFGAAFLREVRRRG